MYLLYLNPMIVKSSAVPVMAPYLSTFILIELGLIANSPFVLPTKEVCAMLWSWTMKRGIVSSFRQSSQISKLHGWHVTTDFGFAQKLQGTCSAKRSLLDYRGCPRRSLCLAVEHAQFKHIAKLQILWSHVITGQLLKCASIILVRQGVPIVVTNWVSLC
jgi:hypothetical protein